MQNMPKAILPAPRSVKSNVLSFHCKLGDPTAKGTMKNISFVVLASSLLCVFQPLFVRAQGALTPPGAPAPTMKTLAQIEPRTPVDATNTPGTASVQYVINQPGSYYLTGNILGTAFRTGITIQTNDVTLDLNGFVMTGNGGTTYDAIAVVGQVAQNNVVIRNGTLRNWASGVWAPFGYCELDDVRVYGCTGNGFQLGNNCTVKNCSAVNNGGTAVFSGTAGLVCGNFCVIKDCIISSNIFGIFGGSDCLVSGCLSDGNFWDGIDLNNNFNVSRCTSDNNGGGGFGLSGNGKIDECTANANFNVGISVNSGCLIKGCFASGNNEDGIYCGGLCVVIDNYASANALDGIKSGGDGNRIENNNCYGNQEIGIESDNGPNADIIVRNTCSANSGGNYSPTNGATFAPIQTPATATSPWANF
jgi:hypothetical protein